MIRLIRFGGEMVGVILEYGGMRHELVGLGWECEICFPLKYYKVTTSYIQYLLPGRDCLYDGGLVSRKWGWGRGGGVVGQMR